MLSGLRLLLIAEQRGFRVWKPNKRSAIVHHQLLPLDQQLQAGTVFGRRGAVAEQERSVDQLDIDPPLHRRLDLLGDIQDAPGGGLRVGERAVGGQFHESNLTFSNAW